MVGDLLSETAVKARGLYDPSAVRRLIELDCTGQEDNAHVIWTMLSTEVWFRTFFGSRGGMLPVTHGHETRHPVGRLSS
jgi:hypothetical protein